MDLSGNTMQTVSFVRERDINILVYAQCNKYRVTKIHDRKISHSNVYTVHCTIHIIRIGLKYHMFI